MKHRHYFPFLVLVMVLVAASAWWIQARAAATSTTDAFEATGVIEARQAALANEIGGKVIAVYVEEGQRVEANQPLLRLDDALIQKQRERAQSELIAAQAALRMLEAGATKDQLDAALAQLSQAQANLQLAQATLTDASADTRPEDLASYRFNLDRARAQYYEMSVVLTNDQLDELESALTQSKDNLARAGRRRDTLRNDSSMPDYVITFSEAAVTDAQSVLDAVQQAYEAAQDESLPYYHHIELARVAWQLAQLNEAQAQARLDGLQADSKVPTDAIDDAQVTLEDAKALVGEIKSAHDELTTGVSAKRLDAAWDELQKAQDQLSSVLIVPGGSAEVLFAQVDAAMGGHHLAVANLSALQNGARDEELDVARARVEAIQAQLDALDIQLSKLTLTAPWDGVILTRSAEVGQVALPGATLIEIGRLEELELTVYLPEEKFGLVVPGQTVQVRVDAYPDRVFKGKVLRMANEAEFTPTNVQTKEDRTRLVYAVVIKLDNSDLELKPGMIADVEFAK
ncbi:MAG TPA: efflux RND transporter periplasmic adaptor subunit [Anaerolineales bacterium]|nr:efflux RND transporter periplasmic adaptor subunit [Anaerolineales bacterium]